MGKNRITFSISEENVEMSDEIRSKLMALIMSQPFGEYDEMKLEKGRKSSSFRKINTLELDKWVKNIVKGSISLRASGHQYNPDGTLHTRLFLQVPGL